MNTVRSTSPERAEYFASLGRRSGARRRANAAALAIIRAASSDPKRLAEILLEQAVRIENTSTVPTAEQRPALVDVSAV
jgi:hypothetical protein